MEIDELRIRDPFITKENDLFYITGTTNNKVFEIFVSPDLKNIVSNKIIFDPEKSGIITECAWAPEIHKYKNNFYLFFTMKESNKNRGSYIAISNKIDGEYKLISNKPITPKNQDCLDATLFIENDTPYLVYCHEWIQIKNGEICVAKLSKDLTKIIGSPKILFKAHDAEWTSPIEKDNFVTDGPFVFKYKNHYFMLWSSFYKGKYALSLIKSKSLFENWIQEIVPAFTKDEGHGMMLKIDDDFYVVRHHPNTFKNEKIKITKINSSLLDF